jgi:glycosyltransferase involved in cell wall biosynthesis
VPNPELPNLLNKSRVFVLLSKYEGNPKTLLEAMSCSLPVIGNNASGISEIINDKETGLIVNNDPSELIKSIDKILNNNSFAKKLGENARQYIVENYNIDKIVNNEAQLIRSMLSNH